MRVKNWYKWNIFRNRRTKINNQKKKNRNKKNLKKKLMERIKENKKIKKRKKESDNQIELRYNFIKI